MCFDARVCFDVCVCLDVCACFDAYVWLGGCLLVVMWPTADQKKARCTSLSTPGDKNTTHRTSTHCNTLQHKRTTHCNTLRHERRLGMSSCTSLATREDNSLKHNTKDCNTLQHTATRDDNALRHTTTRKAPWHFKLHGLWQHERTTHSNTTQRTATHCNTLQHKRTTHGNTQVALACQDARFFSQIRYSFYGQMCCSGLQRVAAYYSQLPSLPLLVSQCVAACCSVLQCVAVNLLAYPFGESACCSVLQCTAVCCGLDVRFKALTHKRGLITHKRDLSTQKRPIHTQKRPIHTKKKTQDVGFKV